MAAVSNIEKYMIDGVEIPVYPTSVSPSDNLVSKSWNNMYGEFIDIPVNLKTKINWIFDVVSDEKLKTLYRKMIRDKILNSKSRFFNINTYFPGVGFISGKYYLGTPTSFTSKDWQTDNGHVNYWQVELHWIEVDGIRLNSPTSIANNNNILNVNGSKLKIDNNTRIEDIIK